MAKLKKYWSLTPTYPIQTLSKLIITSPKNGALKQPLIVTRIIIPMLKSWPLAPLQPIQPVKLKSISQPLSMVKSAMVPMTLIALKAI